MINLRLKIIDENESLLKKEKEDLTNFSLYLSCALSDMQNVYKNFEGIENSLFYEIIFKGLNVTKAVDKVSFKYDKDPSTLWKNYYPKVKQSIEELTIQINNNKNKLK